MYVLNWINTRSWPLRWALKAIAAVVLTVLVLFPRLDRQWTNLRRQRDPNVLIDPDAPELQPLIAEFDARRDPSWDDARMLQEVEDFVERKLPYEWDWNIWSNADYFPTVAEALAVGREDCDGRAVVAASMLRGYGYDAVLVANIKHVWVETERGATMGPGKVSGVRFSQDGPRFNWKILQTLPDGLSLGVAVFPLGRELILALGAWLLLLGRRQSPRRALPLLVLMCFGLMLMREGGNPYLADDPLKQWLGLALIVLGGARVVIQGRRPG